MSMNLLLVAALLVLLCWTLRYRLNTGHTPSPVPSGCRADLDPSLRGRVRVLTDPPPSAVANSLTASFCFCPLIKCLMGSQSGTVRNWKKVLSTLGGSQLDYAP